MDNDKDAELAQIEELKKKRLQAANAHELMRCRETLSLITVAEIFIRASLFHRKPNEWRILEKSDGGLRFSTKPILYKYPVSIPDANKGDRKGE